MANFIAQMFGGGKKKEAAPVPMQSKPKPKPVTQPAMPRAKTNTRYGGSSVGVKEEADITKKMLLGQ